MLYLFDEDGSIAWRVDLAAESQYGGESLPLCFTPRLVKSLRLSDKFDGAGRLVATVVHQSLFPCRTVVLDQHGLVLSEFWNSGHITEIARWDIDNDGSVELVLGGTNNEYNEAIIAVLETAKFNSISPQTVGSNYTQPIERADGLVAYARFPVDRRVFTGFRTYATDLSPTGDTVGFHINWGEQSSLYYYCKSTFSCLIVASDNFIETFSEFQTDQENPELLLEYLSDLEERIQIWDGQGWLSPAEGQNVNNQLAEY